MYHVLTRLIQFVMVDGSTYVSVNIIYNNGMNFTKKENIYV
jgi:ribosomal protein S7